MDDVIKLYWELRAMSHTNGDAIAQAYSVDPNKQPAAFFGMAFNNSTMTLELLDLYRKQWGELTSTTCSSIEEDRHENGQRVILLQKMSFIEIMSSFEYSAKQIFAANSAIFGAIKRRLYLSTVMSKSRDLDLIDAKQLDLWNGVIRLRNSLVHNNGISEETAEYPYPDVVLRVHENAMTQGNLMLFGILTRWLLGAAMSWMEDANEAMQPTR